MLVTKEILRLYISFYIIGDTEFKKMRIKVRSTMRLLYESRLTSIHSTVDHYRCLVEILQLHEPEV